MLCSYLKSCLRESNIMKKKCSQPKLSGEREDKQMNIQYDLLCMCVHMQKGRRQKGNK